MPSRKSDTRRSDVSAARFVLADDDTTMATESPAPEPAEPRASTSTPAAQSFVSDKKDEKKEKNAVTIEDLTLPKSIITRLAKGVLPPNTQIQANAILALTKSATVFVNHLANSANGFTVSSGKKTIMPADVFKALDEIEYGFMREKLEAEFAKFNEVQTSKRSTYRKKVAAAKKAAAAGGNQSQNTADVSMMSIGSAATGAEETDKSFAMSASGAPGSAGQSRAAKKAKLDPSAVDSSKMEVDGHEPSDAETVPEEMEDEEEDEDEEAEEEDDDDEDEEEEPDAADQDRDDLEERTANEGDEDEALDDDSD